MGGSAGVQFVLTLCLLCFLPFANSKANRVPWWQIKVTKSQGPNACIVEEVPEQNTKYWTECKYWPVRKVCGRDTIVRYDCCEGFKKINEEGCTGVKALKNVLETARELGARRFVHYLEEAGLADELTREGTFTLFAPFDHAFETNSGAAIAGRIGRSQADPILNYHLSKTKHPSKDFAGNTDVFSLYGEQKLRISKYSTGMETVNCVLISRKDQEATNGIVHMIDHPLDPRLSLSRDVAQIVIEDGRFRKMADAINRCGFAPRLRDAGSYTILAPSDEAFLKIPPSRLEKMFSDPAACTAMLENHVIPHVMCLPVITEEFKARSIGLQKVAFDCDPERGHVIEGHRLGEYLMGSNGVVYVMDDVLVPDRARTLKELLDTRHLVTFAQLAQVSGLDEMLNGRGDFTIFAPSEAAWYSIDYELLEEAKQNPDLARRLLLFHTTAGPGAMGRMKTSTITNNQMVSSLDGENALRLQIYRKGYGVEDAIIETPDIEGANGVLHIISKVLFPAMESAGDVLRKSGNYSMFLHTMESILQVDPDAIDLTNGQHQTNHYTFFVPTDTAFTALGPSRLRRLQTDPQYMKKVMRNHISSSMAASESFKPNLVYDLPTRQNSAAVQCDAKRNMKVNGAEVLKKDIMSSNGIIHVVDRILLPENDY